MLSAISVGNIEEFLLTFKNKINRIQKFRYFTQIEYRMYIQQNHSLVKVAQFINRGFFVIKVEMSLVCFFKFYESQQKQHVVYKLRRF